MKGFWLDEGGFGGLGCERSTALLTLRHDLQYWSGDGPRSK